MSTLWIFGDSYANNNLYGREHILEQQWHRVLARELAYDYQNLAVSGSSLDYLYHEWHRLYKQFQPGNLVVIVITGLNRRWLLKDRPEFSNPLNLFSGDITNSITRSKNKALLYYYKHLDHPGASEAALYNWLCAVDLFCSRNRVKVLLMPAFKDTKDLLKEWRGDLKHVEISVGRALGNVSYAEHADELVGGKEVLYERDGRCCHLTPPNHRILVDKILDCYKYGKPLDLSKGFLSGLIKTNYADDPELFAREHRLKFDNFLTKWLS